MKIAKVLIFSVFIFGCGEKFSEDSSNNDFDSNSLDPVKIRVIEGNEIGEYKVEFKAEPRRTFSIIKHDFLNDEISEIAVNVPNQFIDEDVVTGETYKYEIGEYTKDKAFSTILVKEIKVPLDLKLEGDETRLLNDYDLEETAIKGQFLLRSNRVMFVPGSRLITQGLSVHFKINKLFSRGGEISTFNEGAKAENGNNGLSGQQIYIEAQYARGDLQIVLRGQDGGEGIRPAPLGIEGKGESSLKKGAPGLAERDIEKPLFGKEIINEEWCKKTPGKGGTGGRGERGLTGGKGGEGGNSGRASVVVSESDDFDVSYEFIPGQGGIGSIGGAGGPGGDGGPSGGEKVMEYLEDEDSMGINVYEYFNSKPQICNANPGAVGLSGQEGEKGEFGTAGAVEIICLKLGINSETKCFKENI